MESLFPDQGWNSCPLHWRCKALTSGLPGKLLGHIFFIHSLVNGYLGCFLVLIIANSAAMNIKVHVFFELVIIFSGYMPRNGIAGSYGNLVTVFFF